FLRDLHLQLYERRGEQHLTLARGGAERPSAPDNSESPPTAFTRFPGARPARVDVRALRRQEEAAAFPLLRLGGGVHFQRGWTGQARGIDAEVTLLIGHVDGPLKIAREQQQIIGSLVESSL